MTTQVLPDPPVLSAFGIAKPRADDLRLSLETSGDTVVSIREPQTLPPVAQRPEPTLPIHDACFPTSTLRDELSPVKSP